MGPSWPNFVVALPKACTWGVFCFVSTHECIPIHIVVQSCVHITLIAKPIVIQELSKWGVIKPLLATSG